MPKVLYPMQEQRYAKTYLNIKKNNKAKGGGDFMDTVCIYHNINEPQKTFWVRIGARFTLPFRSRIRCDNDCKS